jgi:hypothetical protein
MAAVAEPLSPEESGEAMVTYARRHPKAAKNLTKVLGYDLDGSEEAYRQVAEEHIPFVRLRVQ